MSSQRRSQRLKVLGNIALALLAFITAAIILGVVLAPRPEPVVSEKVQQYYDESQARNASPAAARPATKKVAFVGDSYSAGTGTTLKANRWTSVLSKNLGWEELNFARGGTGYVATVRDDAKAACGLGYCPNYLEMVPEVIAAKPDVVVVAGGRNDGAEVTAPLAKNITAVYRELRKGLPNAKIIAFNPIWADEEPPPGADGFAGAVSEAVRSSGGSFVELGQPYQGKPNLITEDAVHPNDAGHAELANVTAAALKAQGLS